MTVNQQTADCSDFDVTVAGETAPAFRVLLPERILADGFEAELLHTIPGSWERYFGLIGGRFAYEHSLEVAVLLMPGEWNLRLSLTVMNIGDQTLENVRADICSAVNHVPGNDEWANEAFLPGIELERSAQGAYWYQTVTPKGMNVLTTTGEWHTAHPSPAKPDIEDVPPYVSEVSQEATAVASAVQAPNNGSVWFFQTWDGPAHSCAPFHGNACMHMHPVVAERLEPGASETVHGVVGIFHGDRDALTLHIKDAFD